MRASGSSGIGSLVISNKGDGDDYLLKFIKKYLFFNIRNKGS